MYVTAIVLAAGRGLRLKSRITKPLIEIKHKPIIIYCLQVLSRHPYIRDIIVVANSKNFKNIARKTKQYKIAKIRNIVLGGKERQDSVCNGLQALDRGSDLVLIHDGVRPFIQPKIVSRVVCAAKRSGAAIVGVPVKATIKSVARLPVCPFARKFLVKKTLHRNNLWEIQTPQVFRKDLILKAYKKFGRIMVSDDAALVEKLGARVSIVQGDYKNIKITTPEDLLLAKAIVR
jgi:2-C-methyl-D-erythritol 4-phosphate cytidylyltransferase